MVWFQNIVSFSVVEDEGHDTKNTNSLTFSLIVSMYTMYVFVLPHIHRLNASFDFPVQAKATISYIYPYQLTHSIFKHFSISITFTVGFPVNDSTLEMTTYSIEKNLLTFSMWHTKIKWIDRIKYENVIELYAFQLNTHIKINSMDLLTSFTLIIQILEKWLCAFRHEKPIYEMLWIHIKK